MLEASTGKRKIMKLFGCLEFSSHMTEHHVAVKKGKEDENEDETRHHFVLVRRLAD
jgi:hypothetical protein